MFNIRYVEIEYEKRIEDFIMKKRFMLSTAGAATVALASVASADLVTLDFQYDQYAGEAGWTLMSSGGGVMGSMYVSGGYIYTSGAVSSSFGSTSPGYAHAVTFDLGAGDYTVVMTDTWGDGWNWAGVAGGVTVNGDFTSFSTGTSMSAVFTVIPAPSALALLGLAGIASRRRRH